MSADAQTVVEQFKALPASEQHAVIRELAHWQKEQVATTGSDPIRTARGMFAGSGLNKALRASRTEERRRG